MSCKCIEKHYTAHYCLCECHNPINIKMSDKRASSNTNANSEVEDGY